MSKADATRSWIPTLCMMRGVSDEDPCIQAQVANSQESPELLGDDVRKLAMDWLEIWAMLEGLS